MAWELSRKGKKAILCEARKYSKSLGKLYSPAGILERGGGKGVTREGMRLSVGKAIGGSSLLFAACAFKPPKSFKEQTGIDLEEELNEVYKDFPVQPLPDTHLGPGCQRIMDAARDLGLDWNPVDKWIRPEKRPPNCGKCFLGCPTGAKITARDYVDEAVKNGTNLLTLIEVE